MTTQQAVANSGSADRAAGTATNSAPRPSSGGRVVSIDALRGFDMFWIIGGGTVFGSLADVWPNAVTISLKRQLGHVVWEGCHFYDLIYPLFLLRIGTVLPFSLHRRQAQGESLARQYLHFLKRSVVLIVLGSIPSGVMIILCGSLAGEWLRSGRSGNQKAGGLAVAGLAGVVLGLVWSLSFPMIKRVVWSRSYVSFACGWSLLLLALFYWVIDVKGYRRWTFFFTVIGMNAITIYFLQTIVNFKDIARLFVGGIEHNAGTFAPLVLPLGILAMKWWLLCFLYQRKAFFKL